MKCTDERYKTLLKINNVIIKQNSKEALFLSLSRELKKVLKHDRFSINIYNGQSRTLSYFTTADGVIPREISWNNRPLREASIAKAVIEERKMIVIEDLSDYASWPSAVAMVKSGLEATIACPLFIRNEIFGTLHLSFRKTPPDIAELARFVQDLSSQVAIAVDSMLAQARLMVLNENLQEQKNFLLRQEKERYHTDNFFYNSPVMKEIMTQVKMVADTDASVLITGETGTGKDYIARCIHSFNPNRDGLFVKVSCPSLSASLFESELFGHAKGAFTGAHAKRKGRFEVAEGGTVFLDEIGDLPVSLQAKLLQVLQEKTIERVGDNKPMRLNVRIIAATNRTPEQLLSGNNFRPDLFYRINTVSITMPPLRERVQDIPLLIEKISRMESDKMNRPYPKYSNCAIDFMCGYRWPGNVRELENLIKRMIILFPGQEVRREKLENILSGLKPHCAGGIETAGPESWPGLDKVEKRHIEETLARTSGRVSGARGAAQLLQIPRSTLLYRMRKHGINPGDYKQTGSP